MAQKDEYLRGWSTGHEYHLHKTSFLSHARVVGQSLTSFTRSLSSRTARSFPVPKGVGLIPSRRCWIMLTALSVLWLMKAMFWPPYPAQTWKYFSIPSGGSSIPQEEEKPNKPSCQSRYHWHRGVTQLVESRRLVAQCALPRKRAFLQIHCWKWFKTVLMLWLHTFSIQESWASLLLLVLVARRIDAAHRSSVTSKICSRGRLGDLQPAMWAFTTADAFCRRTEWALESLEIQKFKRCYTNGESKMPASNWTLQRGSLPPI